MHSSRERWRIVVVGAGIAGILIVSDLRDRDDRKAIGPERSAVLAGQAAP